MAACTRSISDNTVKYSLFPLLSEENSSTASCQNLERIAEKYILKLSQFLTRYIWQDETFNLHVVNDPTGSPSHLEGSTCFGDNIEDEWFIVYLLCQLSKEDKNLVIKVEDSDGDFMLIEAAEYLPKWVNPKTSENRVYIYQGYLHLIPIARNPAEITPIPSGKPSIADAVSAVREFSSVTLASSAVQKTIVQRIHAYPRKIHELQHKAHCYVPASIAAILKEEPRLLPAAVKAFYLRDPLDMKVCRAMKYFPPETRVMTEVLLTRCLYAQLLSQKYEPDSRTGWDLPRPTDPLFKCQDLGMKLACGFEVLASNAKKDDTAFMDVIDIDFSNDVRWKRFLNSLKDKGFFRGEIEGSKLYTQLMSRAKDFYLRTLKQKDSYSTPGTRILQLLDVLNVNYEEMKEAERLLTPPDDDSWMDITPEQLDATLERIANDNNPQNVANAITGTLKTFLRHTSGWEGAEIPTTNKNTKKQKVGLDEDAFSDSVNNILDFRVPNSDDDDGSSSSMSGYSDDDSDEVELKEAGMARAKDINSQAQEMFNDIESYMEQMDRELAQTDVGRSFERNQPCPASDMGTNGTGSDNIDDEEDDFRPVDINLTALKNVLESYSSQHGLPGPASNLFSSMGVQLPQDNDL